MSNGITLEIPARGDHLVMARLVTSAMASRVGMAVDEIDDLRLAVDELCLSVMREVDGGRLLLELSETDGAVAVSCTFTTPDCAAPAPADNEALHELSTRILDALVDQHDRTVSGSTARASLLKRAAVRR